MAEKHPTSLDYGSRAAKLELDVATLIYEGVDTPLSLSCYLLLKYGDITQLVTKTINPIDYNDLERFRDDYQVVSLLSKSKLQVTSLEKRINCLNGYLMSEKLCRDSNERLLQFEDGLVSPLDRRISTVVEIAQSLIAKWIRPIRHKDLESIEEEMSFGPGATVGIKRVVTSGRKYDNPIIDCTPEVLSFGIFCLPEIWKQRVIGFDPISYAELEFVPKNCKTDRAIEIQPSLNIYIQKGIGSFIRSRLHSVGLDLSDQEPNQKLAQLASLDACGVTADLSSASDTISHQCVRLILKKCPDLLSLLEWSRVGRCKLKDGTYIALEKFSAMGNGYTFELETLIFYSLTRAVSILLGDSYNHRVYGDDIITSSSCWPLLRDTLNFLGFNVNARKTYGNTYFRESCGADFYNGVNVRPVFLKQECKTLDDYRELCYIYGNQLLHYSTRRYNGDGRDRRYFRAWFRLFVEVPKHLRFRVPEGFESNGFYGSFDESVPSLKRDTKRGWEGYFFRYSYRPSRTTVRYTNGALINAIRSGTTNFSYGEESLRGRANRLTSTTRTGYTLVWPDFGPWK